jgi:NAD(P) transhydrogenase
MPDQSHYDLVVIGSGPAGQRAAVQAAKLGRRAAIVERDRLGGACIHTGTIPSKTLREAILYLTGYSQRAFYGQGYRLKPSVDMTDLKKRLDQVLDHETDVIELQLERNIVDIYTGTGSFLDPYTVSVTQPDGSPIQLRADHVVIAVGSRPRHPPNTAFDGDAIIDSDQLLGLPQLPRSLTVVGGGVIGIEYASMLAALDIEVTVVDGREHLLDFVDQEIVADLMYHMRSNGVTFRLGEETEQISRVDGGGAQVMLASGKRIRSDMVLLAAGRQANTDSLNLGAAGLETDDRGQLKVNANYQTAVSHIYAAGDVIGFPALAASSMHQGRAASYHAFRGVAMPYSEHFPIGIYGVPSISMIGRTEQELTHQAVNYEVGIARFRESARGQILGLEHGILKLLIGVNDRKLLGVHILGEGATEIVHVGQAVMALGGTLDYFLHTVFNYPTLAGNYKIAALDAYNKLEA